ncbi:MAG: FkbM family methyltransferase [Tabrizicola sp.]|jgi:FkbM family methyltransferase|nr:FkbM family methyltransferase [Tabrizicola sp.]
MSGIGHYFARRYLARMNARHVTHYPQMASFAFDLITQFIHLDGQYERDELKYLADHVFPTLPSGGVCVDIGANIGNHSLAFAPHFIRVIALEPHPRTFRLLDLNAELAPNVTPLNIGASTEAAVVTVAQDPLNFAATSIGKVGAAGAIEVQFRLVRLDDIEHVRGAPLITFIKIDVEGHEKSALIGAEATIRKHQPLIVLEVLPDDIEDGTSAAVEVLKSFGYQHFYELREAGWLGRLPRNAKKAARSLLTIVTGKRPSKAGALVAVSRLEKRSYLMLLCSTRPIPAG